MHARSDEVRGLWSAAPLSRLPSSRGFGAPVVLHGHDDVLGWAHTVNKPPLVDVDEQEMNPQDPHRHRFGGQWLALQEPRAALPLDPGGFTITLHKPVYRSVHGPVYEDGNGIAWTKGAVIDGMEGGHAPARH